MNEIMKRRISYIALLSILFGGSIFGLAAQDFATEPQQEAVMPRLLALKAEPNMLQSTLPEAELPIRVSVENGAFVVHGSYRSIRVYNMLGQEVKNENLPQGLYILRIMVEETLYTVKAVMK